MRKIFFTAGPSRLYPTVSDHIRDALRDDVLSISHRSQKFKDIYKDTVDNLRKLIDIPQDYNIFFLGSATEAMERVIENTVETKSLHLVNGAFSKKFFKIAEQLGRKPEKIEVPHGKGFNIKEIKVPENTECICTTQNETSSGVQIPMDDIYYLKKKNPDVLIVVDIVSSVPNVTVDFMKTDMVFFSVQKGFGLPAGLGVLIVSPAAMDKAKLLFEKGNSIGSFHNFLVLEEYARKYQTNETPNVLEIYLLGKVCEDMLKKSIKTIRSATEKKADLFYNYFDKHPEFKPYVSGNKSRSLTMIVIETPGKAKEIISQLTDAGFIVSSGYGAYKENQIRIANYPCSSIEDVKNLIVEFRKLS